MLTDNQQVDSFSHSDDDLAKLSFLDENILLEHLKQRYDNDLIYTYLGDILVSLNPFKETQLYTKAIQDFYRTSSDIRKPPHVYALVDLVYRNVCNSVHQRQCCVISGESGSGKTESTKLFLRQLMYLCGGSSQLEQQILQATPLLESFGNAQTVMNNNSSRFGKYIALKFINGKIVGGQISDYLLEKSRVVTQSPGERNFHIFYYLFDQLPNAVKRILCLSEKKNYKYLGKNISNETTESNDSTNRLEEVTNAMGLLNFTDKEQNSMFRILSGILTIGNLEFATDDEGFTQQNFSEDRARNILLVVGKMFGVQPELIMECLTTVTTLTRHERVTRKFSLQSSQDARDALSKHLYSRLFSWIISKINETLNNPFPLEKHQSIFEIGLLDIFGFEHFELNSFEQLCINLANEQIQFFFNQNIFRMELCEYENEGILIEKLNFIDNQTLLDLFIARPVGILSLLDDESRLPKASDQTLVEKLNFHFGSNKNEFYSVNRNNKFSFAVQHYAGRVSYCAVGFLEKNRDTLSDSVVDLLKNSQDELIRFLFNGKTFSSEENSTPFVQLQIRTAAEKDARNRLTVGAQYRNSLQILMERMCASRPVFMRCLKPNQEKKSDLFDERFVRAQLRYCGMLETTRIRKQGFSVRLTFEEFLHRYAILSKRKTSDSLAESCRQILIDTNLTDWEIGKTKVFLKYFHPDFLEKFMEKYRKSALKIQRNYRGYRCRKHLNELKSTVNSCVDEVERFSMSIENLNKETVEILSRLEQTMINNKNNVDTRPVPPVRESSLNLVNNTITNGKYSLPMTLTSTPYGTLTADQLLMDYDSLLSQLTLKYGSPGDRESCLRWFRDTQYPFVCPNGSFPTWFHGCITRHRAEELLSKQSIGVFLIRLSESRFGFSLSFRAEDRCRHYMINQLRNSKYNVIGEAKVHKSLESLIEFYRKNQISNWNGFLGDACEADWTFYNLESLTPLKNVPKTNKFFFQNSTNGTGAFSYPPKIYPKRSAILKSSMPIAIVPPFAK